MEGSLNNQTGQPADEPQNSTSSKAGDEPEDGQDLFKRLPDDFILTHIIDKICEAKSLCLITLVSKHLASLVFQTQAVSLRIVCMNSPPHMAGRVLDLITATKFLIKFTSIKSLSVELCQSWNLTHDTANPPVVKWKIDSKSASFVILTAGSLHLGARDDDNDEGNYLANPDQVRLLRRYFNCYMQMVCWGLKFVEMLLEFLPQSVRNIVVTDSDREGKLDLGEIDIIQIRNGNRILGNGEANIRVWHAPFLRLPSSGGVMKIVTLCISKNSNRIDYDDFLIAKEAFDGEADHRVYVEAIMEMLKRNVDSKKILPAQDFSFRLSLDDE